MSRSSPLQCKGCSSLPLLPTHSFLTYSEAHPPTLWFLGGRGDVFSPGPFPTRGHFSSPGDCSPCSPSFPHPPRVPPPHPPPSFQARHRGGIRRACERLPSRVPFPAPLQPALPSPEAPYQGERRRRRCWSHHSGVTPDQRQEKAGAAGK